MQTSPIAGPVQPKPAPDLLPLVVREFGRALRPSNAALAATSVSGRAMSKKELAELSVDSGHEFQLKYRRWLLRVRVTALLRPANQVIVRVDLKDTALPGKLAGWQRVHSDAINSSVTPQVVKRLLSDAYGNLTRRPDVARVLMDSYRN